MRTKLHSLMLAAALLAPVAMADPVYERQLAELTQKRDKAIAEAVEPINRVYRTSLEELIRKATLANDLDSALKIREVLDSSAGSSPFQGRWNNRRVKSRILFSPDGAFKETWDNEVSEGKWVAISPTEVRVTLKNGSEHQYILSDDRKSVKRTKEGYVWTRDN